MMEAALTVTESLHNRFQRFIAKVTGEVVFPNTPRETIRRMICQIELAMEQAVKEGFLVDTAKSYPLDHRFAKGIYVREIFIPAGHFLVGRIHKEAHYNVITKGKVSVLTEEAGVELLTGPVSMISPAGCKRVLFTHEDTWWTVTHVTDLTDLEEIEAAVIAPSYTAMGWDDPKVELLNSAVLQNSNAAELFGKELLWSGQR
jgi:hypothetical protein